MPASSVSATKRILSVSALIFSVLLLTGAFLWLSSYHETTTVTFLDVGQGDAILISEGSNQILIDGGRSGKDLLSRIGRQIPFWDRTIEVVIATHPDADHIGGLAALLFAYEVPLYLSTGAESDTETYALLREALAQEHSEIHPISRGGNIRFPSGSELRIEYPEAPVSAETKETNASSIVARFTYGETEVLLTGDLSSEETVLTDILPADILKVAHHGSKYSTSADFLDLVHPEEAIISVGKNRYGHPSPEVLSRLSEREIDVWRTDTDGDIRYRCTPDTRRCQKEKK